jgi:hypothetical protein
MFFLSSDDSAGYLTAHGVEVDSLESHILELGQSAEAFDLEKAISFGLCRQFVAAMDFRTWSLLYVYNKGTAPSLQNWHLYYRLRTAYGNSEKLDKSPGHLFLDFERADLSTFLYVCASFGLVFFLCCEQQGIWLASRGDGIGLVSPKLIEDLPHRLAR